MYAYSNFIDLANLDILPLFIRRLSSIFEWLEANGPFVRNDATLFGILMVVLALIFWTSKSEHPFWQKFYKFVPILLLAYFIPAILRSFGLIAPEWLDADGVVVKSQLYFVASRYLLPACLILLCLSIDIKGIIGLGPKAIVMFLAASLGIILGGPVALLVVTQLFPNLIPIPADQLWTGFSTIAGSWIGGGANQTAMKEIFDVADDLFGMMIIVDILVANIWLGFLLYGINVSDRIDRFLKADNSAIERLKKSVSDYRSSIEQMPTVTNTLVLMGVAFGGTALAHWAADSITPWMSARSELLENLRLNSLTSGFFWLIVVATTVGFGLSFTKAKRLEGVGASRWGTIFIYILVATIGMKMDLSEIFERKNAGLLLIGVIWMMIHVLTLFIVAYIIRAPYFFIAVGSQANVGGAASAPVVAAAFDSALAPVGVLMAVLGYALGTYGALICALMMQGVVS